MLELLTDEPARFARAEEALAGAIEVGPGPVDQLPLVIERVG